MNSGQVKSAKMNKQGLHNPAVVGAVVSSPQGQKAIESSLQRTTNTVNQTAQIVKGVLKTGLFIGVGIFAYKKLFNGFSTLSEDRRKTPSNISSGMAKNKAEAIYSAMYGLGNGFKSVKQNLLGVNHNGFVRIYNAFGQRKGVNPLSKKMTLTDWFIDQFSPSELIELRFIIPHFF